MSKGNKSGERTIFLADCQSFYASVEKADHPGLANKPVAVAGDPALRSGIILAACPVAKGYGVSTAERLGEALKKCPELIVMRPRMQHYIDVSLMITKIYEEFTHLVEVFSIDEQFLDVTGGFSLYGNAEMLAATLQYKVLKQTGVKLRVGISSNKILAKIAADIGAKKNASGIFTLYPSAIEELLWKEPVSKMFGVGSRMTVHFAKLGMYTVGDVARTSLPQLKKKFRARFGKKSDIHAEVMWRTANGLDDSPVTPGTFDTPPKSIGHMMTLPRDYAEASEVNTILMELTEEVCRDCRRKGYMASIVTVSCMCSPFDAPTGFSRQMKLPDPTNHTGTVFQAVKQLFYTFWDTMPVRRAGVMLSQFVDAETYQLTLFEDQVKARELERVTDRIKDRFGNAAIIRASSLTAAGQAHIRSLKIGGHYK